MPYIPPDERPRLDERVDALSTIIQTDGQLNYVITRLIHLELKHRGLSYDHLKELQGVLHGALAEFDRVVVGPYEAKKRILNGDIGVLGAI